MFDDCVILAGGSGTRLWPASSSRLPKQFLPSVNGKSFFFMAVERALAVSGNTADGGRVIIIAGKNHIPHIIAAAAKFSAEKKKRILVIGEPEAKNTAAAVACAVSFSRFRGGNRNMLVLTSDHIIKPLKTFIKDASLAAAREFCVFGIPPAGAQTGYGYIETKENKAKELFTVASFHEKPDLSTAQKYLERKNYFWNSGMFAFNINFMENEFLQHAPDVYLPFIKLKSPKASDFTVTKGIKILKNGRAWQPLIKKRKKSLLTARLRKNVQKP